MRIDGTHPANRIATAISPGLNLRLAKTLSTSRGIGAEAVLRPFPEQLLWSLEIRTGARKLRHDRRLTPFQSNAGSRCE